MTKFNEMTPRGDRRHMHDAQITAMAAAGAHYWEIASATGLSRSGVWFAIGRLGLPRITLPVGARRSAGPPERVREMLAARAAGASWRALGRQFGVSHQTARSAVKYWEWR